MDITRSETCANLYPIKFRFAGRFVDDAFGFALTWNYWFNDAVSVASDLTALQLVFEYWNTDFPAWALGLIFWFALVCANIITVRAYGEVCILNFEVGIALG